MFYRLERSIWKFYGSNSGKIEFIPNLPIGKIAEIKLEFNTSKSEGNILCTRDETFFLKAELFNQNIIFSLNDIKSKRVLKSVACKPQHTSQFNDKNWHKIHLIKRSRGQV